MTSGVNPSQRMLTLIRRVGANVKQLLLHRGQATFLTTPGNLAFSPLTAASLQSLLETLFCNATGV